MVIFNIQIEFLIQ